MEGVTEVKIAETQSKQMEPEIGKDPISNLAQMISKFEDFSVYQDTRCYGCQIDLIEFSNSLSWKQYH
jgi:hypothetical protein